jgi:ribosomal protein S6
MIRYETLILAHPDLKKDDEQKIEKLFEELTSNKDCELISFERWGKYSLTYPVRKEDYGIYFLVRYSLPKDLANKYLHEVHDFFKIRCSETVMRYVHKALAEGASLEYQKPLSMDEQEAEPRKPYEQKRHESFDKRPAPASETSEVKEEVVEVEEKDLDKDGEKVVSVEEKEIAKS